MSTYKDAGVDIDAGDRAVELMKASIAKASRPEVMGGIGGFAKGGDFNRKHANRIMRYRIYAQFVAVLLILAVVYFAKG